MRKPIFHEDLMRLFPRGTLFLIRFTTSNIFSRGNWPTFHELLMRHEVLMRLFPRGTLIPRDLEVLHKEYF